MTPTPIDATPTIEPIYTSTAEESQLLRSENTWSDYISVRMPTLNEIRDDMVSIWDANLLDVDDISSPGTRYYDGIADLQKDYLWPFRWCTLNKNLLDQNIENMNVKFYVNDELVPSGKIFYYRYDTNTGWNCGYWATVLSGWKKNSDTTLTTTYTIFSEIYDGNQYYQPGDYTHQLKISAR